MALNVGDKAPQFRLENQEGKKMALTELSGSWVLIYFYPKDDTPGCTKEACAIRDEFPRFSKLDAVVLGVSADSVSSHRKFKDKYKLPFDLLSDTDRAVIKSYGAWGEKSMYGKKYEGIMRMSFLVDPKGRITKIYPKVKPEGHAEEVLIDLQALRKDA